MIGLAGLLVAFGILGFAGGLIWLIIASVIRGHKSRGSSYLIAISIAASAGVLIMGNLIFEAVGDDGPSATSSAPRSTLQVSAIS